MTAKKKDAGTTLETGGAQSSDRERDHFLFDVASHRDSRSKLLEKKNSETSLVNDPPSRLERALNWVLENDHAIGTKRGINIFYVYVHRHPVTEAVFYVGKGVDGRAWNMLDRRPEHTEALYELLKEGHAPGSWVSLVKWGLTELESLRAEDKLIRELIAKGVDLVNRKKPLAPSVRPSSPPLRDEFIQRIVNVLESVPPKVHFLSIWELFSKLNIGKSRIARSEVIDQVKIAFQLGIDGWFLDEYLNVRRSYNLPTNTPQK